MIKIITDTGSDLTHHNAQELGISLIDIPITDNEGYDYSMDKDLTIEDFYMSLADGKMYTTSQININTYYENFKSHLDQGYDLLYIGLSSGLSGTVQSANQAKKTLEEEYPDRTIEIFDSKVATLPQMLMALRAKKMADEARTIEEIKEEIVKMQENAIILFMVDDLDHLHRGGRVSKATSVVGGMFNIIPILELDPQSGKLGLLGVGRGKNNLKKKLKQEIDKKAGQSLSYDQDFWIFGANYDKDKNFDEGVEFLEKGLSVDKEQIKSSILSPVIGVHTGPNMWAINFFKDPGSYGYFEDFSL